MSMRRLVVPAVGTALLLAVASPVSAGLMERKAEGACTISPWTREYEAPTGQWLLLEFRWGAATDELVQEFLDKTSITATLDGKTLKLTSLEYDEIWLDETVDPAVTVPGWYPFVFMQYLIHPLRPGVHAVGTYWVTLEALTDGWYLFDEGHVWEGVSTVVVTPRGQFPTGQYQEACPIQ